MSSFDSDTHLIARSVPSSAANLPSACPGCQSSSITTLAKKPDMNAYWRCGKCGEVWNATRRAAVRSGAAR